MCIYTSYIIPIQIKYKRIINVNYNTRKLYKYTLLYACKKSNFQEGLKRIEF